MDKKVIHVAAEVALFGALYFYVNKKNKDITLSKQDISPKAENISFYLLTPKSLEPSKGRMNKNKVPLLRLSML